MAIEGVPAGVDLSRVPVREPPPPRAKRFYREVTVAEAEGRFQVLLDGRPVKTPVRKVLEAPSRALAEAIAAEWQAQADEIDPTAMPLTRLTSTALDRIAPERAAITEQLLAYVDTDLLCYRAPHPADLKARQEAIWQPVLDWLEATQGIGLSVAAGILPIEQPPEAAAAAHRAIDDLSVEKLTALQAAVGATGSLALGLALVHGRLGSAEAFAAAQLDETYQNETWGEDEEALERRRRIAAEVDAIGRYLSLIV